MKQVAKTLEFKIDSLESLAYFTQNKSSYEVDKGWHNFRFIISLLGGISVFAISMFYFFNNYHIVYKKQKNLVNNLIPN
jgi:hypothetical protein